MGDSQGEGATRKGPRQSVLHSPFFRGRMFWEERVCWQPDPPAGCGDLQRRGCWQLTFPPSPVGFFCPFTMQIPPPTDLLISSFFLPQHTLSHIQVLSYHAPHQEASPRCSCGRAALPCSDINQLPKNNNLRGCVSFKWEQEPDGWERQWQMQQHREGKEGSL